MLRCIRSPEIEPISLDEAKLFLRIDHQEEDSLIQMLITAAREYGETVQKRILATQTWEWKINGFPNAIELPLAPVQSVDEISYIDKGNEKIIHADHYEIRESLNTIASQTHWPDIEGPITITFTVGYTPKTIPVRTKQALLLLISTWYEYREAFLVDQRVTEVPLAVQSLLALDRRW